MPVGDGFLGRVVDALGRPLDDKGPITAEAERPPRGAGAQRGVAPAGEGAAVHRHHRDRRDDRHRARPAPADHRRPPDGQDRRGGRRDHRPARALGHRSARCSASTWPIGQKASTVAEVVETLRENGALEYTVVVNAGRGQPGAVPVHRAVRRRRARRALDVRAASSVADRVRRPVQAGGRLSRDLAAAPPSARPRGLPGRRLLPALPAARACGEALRRARRRLADRAADHRDQGRRRLRLHPDERHLDHRRADLPGVGAVLLRRPPGDQRRHLGVAASAATRRSRR